MSCSNSSLMGIGCVAPLANAVFLSLHLDDLPVYPLLVR